MLLGTVELGSIPRVVLAVSGEDVKGNLFRARELKIDIVEARVDLIRSLNLESAVSLLDMIGDFGFPAILTVRPVWEGGKFEGDEEGRLSLIAELVKHPCVAAVDIELRAGKIRKRAISLSKLLGKKVIVSYHDFKATPDDEEIVRISEEMRSIGADIMKFAFTASSNREVSRAMCSFSSIDFPKVFMLMGEAGKISRVAGFTFGSLLTYTFFGEPVAPGQIEAERLVKLLSSFYPTYGREKLKFV